jgi:hypothetical protein
MGVLADPERQPRYAKSYALTCDDKPQRAYLS